MVFEYKHIFIQIREFSFIKEFFHAYSFTCQISHLTFDFTKGIPVDKKSFLSEFWFWWLEVGESSMVAKIVTSISNLSPTHSVSTIILASWPRSSRSKARKSDHFCLRRKLHALNRHQHEFCHHDLNKGYSDQKWPYMLTFVPFWQKKR